MTYDFVEDETWYYVYDDSLLGGLSTAPQQPPVGVFHGYGTSVPKACAPQGLRPVAKRVLTQKAMVSDCSVDASKEVTHEDMVMTSQDKGVWKGWFVIFGLAFVGIICLFVYFVCKYRR